MSGSAAGNADVVSLLITAKAMVDEEEVISAPNPKLRTRNPNPEPKTP